MDKMGYDLKLVQFSVKFFTFTSNVFLSQGENPHGRIEYCTCMDQHVKFISFHIRTIRRL